MKGFDIAKNPTKPDAKRGDFSPTPLAETDEQLKNKLIWDRCNFCGGFVLIDSFPMTRSREKCQCGARRISRYVRSAHGEKSYQDGWRKDGIEWVGLE